MSDDGKPFSEILQQMMRMYKLEGKLDEVQLATSWKDIAGDMIARHTREVKVKDGVLFLTVDSPALKHELQYHRTTILEKVNQHLSHMRVSKMIIR